MYYGKNYATYAPEEQARVAMARRVAQEGMVLVENNGVLPLSKGRKAALIGVSQLEFLHAGSGSGAAAADYVVQLPEALTAAGLELDQELLEIYADYGRSNTGPKEPMHARRNTMPELLLTPAQIQTAAAKSDLAVVCFSRLAGEGRDRTLTGGDYYLSETEQAVLAGVRAAFSQVVVLLNISSVMDMEWVDLYTPDAVLITWLPGMEGANAAADLLVGNATPSGKLADTFAKDYWDIPSSHNFGSRADGFELYTGDENQVFYWGGRGNDEPVPVGETVVQPKNHRRYVEYQEGLYVGYRYFETFDVPVRYPFGYGLSYTTFEKTPSALRVEHGTALFSVTVTNTGAYSGQEVVQIYVSAPDGKLERPSRELKAFAKTGVLAPGQQETLEFAVALSELAAYSEEQAAWVLEQGGYTFLLGGDVRQAVPFGAWTLNEDRLVEQLKNRFALCHTHPLPQLSKFDKAGTWPKAHGVAANSGEKHGKNRQPDYNFEIPDLPEAQWKLKDVAEGRVSMETFLKQADTLELLCLLVGTKPRDARYEAYEMHAAQEGKDGQPMFPLDPGPILEPLGDVPLGASGYTAAISRLGIPSISFCDGPAGVSTRGKAHPIAFPTAQLTACTWNPALAYELGSLMGQDVAENHVDVWLAPSLNLHRNPLCGRNYEYYSEDPVLSGMMAANIINGAQQYGITVCPKHFAANNQETSRWDGLDTIVTERVLRELYLKGFEILVKQAHPKSIMTAYTALNGPYCAASWDLNTGVLREDWGFDGFVVTDWEGDGIHSVEALEAGNDLLMPGFRGQVNFLLTRYNEGRLSRQTLECCAGHILNFVIQSQAFKRYLEHEGQSA